MAAAYGRDITVKWKTLVLLGVIEKSMSIGGEPADITSSEDDGYRKFLTENGTKSIDISISGVEKDSVIRAAALQQNIDGAVLITYHDGATLAFTGILTGFEFGLPQAEAITFSAKILSNGSWTYTPAV
jgi:predicted secreted protein